MFVTTAKVGVSIKNERSLSSASTTIKSLFPKRALEPIAPTTPPTTTVGSSPACASTVAIIEVVVVLPCEPATATVCGFRRINSPSISARGMTGIERRRASNTSGLSPRTAVERTTTCAPPTFSAACPS
jgi:hypothetical protein